MLLKRIKNTLRTLQGGPLGALSREGRKNTKHLHIYLYIHVYKNMYINICMYVFMYIHSYIHTYIHTYVYTYIRIYVYTYVRNPCPSCALLERENQNRSRGGGRMWWNCWNGWNGWNGWNWRNGFMILRELMFFF